MPSDSSDKTASGFAAKWGVIAAVLTGLVLVIDFLTKSIGLVEVLKHQIIGEPDPVVLIRSLPFENSSSCLEFAFSDLPESFELGEIILSVLSSEGPEQISGDMAAEVFEKTVNDQLSPAYLVGQKTEITVPAKVQASKPNDALYLHYCPTLTVPGTKGRITVSPTFYDVGGNIIAPLNVRSESENSVNGGFEISLVRPKNERVTIVATVSGLLPE